jgi:hypothetical protein
VAQRDGKGATALQAGTNEWRGSRVHWKFLVQEAGVQIGAPVMMDTKTRKIETFVAMKRRHKDAEFGQKLEEVMRVGIFLNIR